MDNFNLAVIAHKSNKTSRAKTLYAQHLQSKPNDPAASQLLGLLFLQEGSLDQAIFHLENSLKHKPEQPHVWCNLAIGFSHKNLLTKAIESYQQAIVIDRTYVTAYKDLAKILRLAGRYKEAESILIHAEEVLGKNVEIINEKIRLFRILERNTELLYLYDHLEKSGKLTQNQYFHFAIVLRIEGNPQKALNIFKSLAQAGMSNFQINHNLGNVYSDMGSLEEAINYYQKAIDINELYIESHINLNELLWEAGHLGSYLSSYIKALKNVPNDEALNFNYISSLMRTENYEEGRNCLLALPQPLKNKANYFYYMSQYFTHKQQLTEAITLQERSMLLDDLEGRHILAYVKNLLQTNDIVRAESILTKFLDTQPDEQLAIAYLGVCYRLLGKKEEKIINNYTDLVKAYSINIEKFGNNIDDYCEVLNDYLSELHTSTNQPLEQTLYKGTQTRGNLFNNDDEVLVCLVEQIKTCLSDYIAKIPDDKNQYSLQQGKEFKFSGSWSARLDKEGYHSVHVHPMGWLSAVFYVELPEAMKKSTDGKEGWLKFGEPDLLQDEKLLAEHFVKPEIGKLVIFPSYMWHGTVPLSHTGSRTTVAFDVVKC